MALDLEAIRRKLQQLNKKSNNSQWKPAMPKDAGDSLEYTVRLLPYTGNDGQPFKELYFYYNIGKGGILAPKQFGKPDPIQDLIDSLLEEKGNKENWNTALKLFPKMRAFAPIIVRGEEEQGVRLWSFGKQIYQKLLSILLDEDYGDVTDVKTGRDIKVKFSKVGGKEYLDTDISVRPKESVATKDAELLGKWLDSIPDPVSLYPLKSKEEIEKILTDWLDGGQGNDSDGSSRGGSDSKSDKSESKKEKTATDDSSTFDDLDEAFKEVSN